MKKTKHLAGLAAAFTLVGLSGMAQASNVVIDGTFENTTALIYTPTYNGDVGTWLTDGTWSLQTTGGYDDNLHYSEAGSEPYGQETSLYQVIHHSGDAGTISYSYALKLPLMTIRIYGMEQQTPTKPTSGTRFVFYQVSPALLIRSVSMSLGQFPYQERSGCLVSALPGLLPFAEKNPQNYRKKTTGAGLITLPLLFQG